MIAGGGKALKLGAKSAANEDAFLQQLCAEGEKLSVGHSIKVFNKFLIWFFIIIWLIYSYMLNKYEPRNLIYILLEIFSLQFKKKFQGLNSLNRAWTLFLFSWLALVLLNLGKNCTYKFPNFNIL